MSKKDTGPTLFEEGFEVTYDEPIDLIDIDNDIKDYGRNNKKRNNPPKERPSENNKNVSQKRPVNSNTDKIPVVKKVTNRSRPKAYGNRHIYDTSFYVIRTASVIIAVSIILLLTIDFLRGAAPYGDITTILQTYDTELIAYLAVSGCIILLFSLLLLFSFVRDKVVKRGRTYKLDMGKGIGTFISIYLVSYISFIVCAIIPDTFDNMGYTFIDGIIGALDVFGSMHNILLGMCVAGVISCIARKHMN